MYKKKAPTTSRQYSAPLVAAIITALVFCVSEYFLSFPSSVLHSPMFGRMPSTQTETCTADVAPICGKDGKTYTNSCMARLARVGIARAGKCESPVSVIPVVTETGGVVIDIPLTPPALSGETAPLPTSTIDLEKAQTYTNTSYRYTLKLPKYAYYQGNTSADKKAHILSIGLDADSVSSPSTALITATYYRTGTIPPSTGKKSLTLTSGTLVLDYTAPLSAKGQAILDTIVASAESLPL